MIIPVSPPGIPPWVFQLALNNNLHLKTEFHFTVIPFWMPYDREASMPLRGQPWQVNFLPEYYLAQRDYEQSEHFPVAHTRRSLIQRVECPDLEQECNRLELPFPSLPHVTLFVSSEGKGIGIFTSNDPGTLLWQVSEPNAQSA